MMIFILGFLFLLNCAGIAADPAAENFYYSDTVTEATQKFANACNHSNGTIEYINHPELGANNESLKVAVCSVGNASSDAVVLTISGTHGIEGYAGSMAQISMLRGPSSMFPPSLRMVHIHMINPYGASHVLKENEQNADQLKNEAGYYALDYDNPIVHELMDGIDWPNLATEQAQQNAITLYTQLIVKYGLENVNAALKTGQGKRPQGIAYFGPSKSWSTTTLEYILNKYVGKVSRILLLDWHTAVGPHGVWSFMAVDQQSESIFKRWAPTAATLVYDLGLPTGGVLPYSRLRTMTGAKKVIRGLWEAGTEEVTIQTNSMFILRLYCRFYSTPTDPFCQAIIAQTRQFFYPQLTSWKNMTYHGINKILPSVLAGFAAESNKAIVTLVSMTIVIVTTTISLLLQKEWSI